ncbi:MAG: hypothetical protein ABEH83_10465, partial [Halobacterium sp.]
MDCSRCGRTADYDRVTIHRPSGSVEGSLCTDCEDAWLNGHAENGAPSMTTCFECGNEPEFLFPQWDSIVEREDGTGVVETEYRIQLVTPASCRDCLD